jgi:hypothetical protein
MIAAIRRRERRPGEDLALREEAERLAALVRECLTSGIARRACVLHLSRLPPELARPHHLRLARAALEPLAHADRARMFELPNLDLVTVWRGAAEAALSASREAILRLFDDAGGAGAPPATLLWQELSLPQDAAILLRLAEGEDGVAEAAVPAIAAPPLDPTALAAFEAGLVHADVARFARRRQVCLRLPDGSFRRRWEKRFLSVEELAASLAPNHAPRADPWLFRRLTRSLDRRMLALLAAPDELTGAGPFAINLNVASVLSPEFLRFDAALPAALRGQVILDLLPADVLADPAAFLFARDFAQARFYRILLRGVTADLLPMFPLARTGLDYLQLRWSPSLMPPDSGVVLEDASRIVLSQADSRQAVSWGVAHGITLFQGQMAVPATRPQPGIA